MHTNYLSFLYLSEVLFFLICNKMLFKHEVQHNIFLIGRSKKENKNPTPKPHPPYSLSNIHAVECGCLLTIWQSHLILLQMVRKQVVLSITVETALHGSHLAIQKLLTLKVLQYFSYRTMISNFGTAISLSYRPPISPSQKKSVYRALAPLNIQQS